MSDSPLAIKKRTSYENFVAQCPWCGKESIFNRASDLRTFEPIAGKSVSCQNVECRKLFRITGDRINNPHEMLILDCYELIKLKHYMACILSLTQAYEVFFSLFFRVELLYRPFSNDPAQGLGKLNKLHEELYENIKKHSFHRMRGLFLQHVVRGVTPKNLDEAAAQIANLSGSQGTPKDAAIASLSYAKLVPFLMDLKKTSINTIRNRIVHKEAYRPTRDEVEAALEEARSILFPLTSHLQLYSDINWYMQNT